MGKTRLSLRAHKAMAHKTGTFPTKKSKKNGGKTERRKKKSKSNSTRAEVETDKDEEDEYSTALAALEEYSTALAALTAVAEDNTGEDKNTDKPDTSFYQEDLIPEDGIKAEPPQDETANNTEELQLKRPIQSSAEEEADDLNTQKTKKQRTVLVTIGHKKDLSVSKISVGFEIKSEHLLEESETNTVTETKKESDAEEEDDTTTNEQRLSLKPSPEGTVAVTDYTVATYLEDLDDKIKSMMMISENRNKIDKNRARICKVCGK